ncbi:MAG TPA: beta-N-acetylhexosaminidase [Verrucomicrobiae bacterium]|nr:beta-N-acetylhexosaminidase [Verrucomicrobiae bacterium]
MKKLSVAFLLLALAAPFGQAATLSIIPLPQQMQARPGIFTLCPSLSAIAAPGHPLVKIYTDSTSQSDADFLAQQLFKSTGQQFAIVPATSAGPIRQGILLTTANANTNLNYEGYELTVAPDSVVIRAPTSAGVFYGVQSLLQLLPPQVLSSQPVTNVLWTVPCVYIFDQPQYHWRGAMLDVARHFITKQQTKQLLDAMALHKLNVFHWHLCDDQGWRLEITNYPALTTNSAWRTAMDYSLNPRSNSNTNSLGQYGGFYTQADAREIVAYAQQLHITVVPEIELPCHASAALAAYPQFGCGDPQSDFNMDYPHINYGTDLFSPGSPGTLAFFYDVLSETMAIFPGQYIHCGGDEVIASGDKQWNSYSNDVNQMAAVGITVNGNTSIEEYQYWLSTNLNAYIQANGRSMIGWSEYDGLKIVPNAAVMDWETGSSSDGAAVAEAGDKVVSTSDNYCYLNYVEGTNLTYEPPFIVGSAASYSSISNVYAFNPIPSGLPAQYNTNILGAEGTLFTEYVPSFENVMYKMFPRLDATAEITWTPLVQQTYSNFTQRLPLDEQRLAAMGANYNHESIPAIGAWGPVPAGGSTLQWNITTNVTAAGEIDVSFSCALATNGLKIAWTDLLQNGTEIDRDTHNGYAQNNSSYAASTTNQTVYVLHLPVYQPGATYTIGASVQAIGNTNSSGTVYLPNWN